MKPRYLLIAALIIVLSACQLSANQFNLTTNRKEVFLEDTVVLKASAGDPSKITKVVFYSVDQQLGEDFTAPFDWQVPISKSDNGTKVFIAKAFDSTDKEIFSDSLTINIKIQPTGWYQLGSTLGKTAELNSRVLAIDSSGAPVVGWQEDPMVSAAIQANPRQTTMFVHRFDGINWQVISDKVPASQLENVVNRIEALVLDRQDNPIIAVSEAISVPEDLSINILMYRWDGRNLVRK
jgi:Bacterial Ig domain